MNLDPDPGYLDIKCVRLKEIEFSCAIQEIAFSCARLKETAPGCASLVEITTSYTVLLYCILTKDGTICGYLCRLVDPE